MITGTFSNDDLFNQELINNIILTKSYRHLTYDISSYVVGVACENNEYVVYMTDQYGHIVYKKGYNSFGVANSEALKVYEVMLGYMKHDHNVYTLE